MRNTPLYLLLTVILITFCHYSSFAQETSAESSSWVLSSPQDWPAQIRPGIRGGEGDTRHYADVFIPLFGDQDSFFFLNPKLTLTSHSQADANEENIGLGYRQLIWQDRAIFGTNLFFDTRKSDNDVRHDQLGFGLELLGERFDLRSNFYFPISDKEYLKDNVIYGFTSNTLTKYATPVYEEPLRGLDYEVGVLVPFISDLLETRCFIGGYHYSSKYSDEINGVRARLEIKPAPAFTLNLEITDDNISSTNTYVGGYITMPFSLGNLFNNKNPFEGWKEQLHFGQGTRPIRQRMTDMIIRDLDIRSSEFNSTQVSTKEHDVVFVDNSNDTGIEDGTYEHPYDTIQEGIDNVIGDKWVYVMIGDADYAAGGSYGVVDIMTDEGITLWGSGYDGGFAGIGSDSGPVIDGSDFAYGINIQKDNTTVMGFTVENAGANVSGEHNILILNCSGVTIKHNNINAALQYGVVIGNLSDVVDMSGFEISYNSIINNSEEGIYVLTLGNGGISDVTISNNTISGSAVGILLSSQSAGNLSGVTVSRNTITGNLYGIGVINSSTGSLSNFNIGNAAAGTAGYNSVYNNSITDLINGIDGSGEGIDNLKAENNYWGGGALDAGASTQTVDADPYLTSNPN